ncbi:glucan phosphoethanolaminetransferase (alkaline phosphatase superfamily) [Leifsonia sp. 1010]|nr:glucan phosphoethanolaminetransferase (alkaline phosphatase superfamily) [Leifsonia sp. 1010]
MIAPATTRTEPAVTDRWLLVASIAVSVLAPVVWPALIGAAVLLVWVSVRLARQRPRSVALLTTAIVALSLSIAFAVALGVATAATVSDPGDGGVTLIQE